MTMRTTCCPGCQGDLVACEAGGEAGWRCAACGGLWLDQETLGRLTAQAVEPGGPVPGGVPPARQWAPTRPRPEAVRYRRCPGCGDVMNRVDFARVSGVVLDVCRRHGAFFDAGELERIRRFLAEGGARRLARARELEEERGRRADRGRPGAIEDDGVRAGVDGLELMAALLWS